jgi:hypothetical protein
VPARLPARHVRRGLALAAVSALPLALLVPLTPQAAVAAPASGWFERIATYPVFQNVPAGVDPAAETVAEISAVTDDGNTVVYTDALGKRIGFLNIADPANPVGAGSYDLSQVGDADDQPTSVAVVGQYVLVVVDTSGGDFANPSGRLDVVSVATRQRVAQVDLGGQPDSIAISPDKAYAAIAIENQRDEDATPPGGEEGDLPQAPAGFVQVVELAGAPTGWTADPITLGAADLAGLDTPEDAEPEYVDINADNELVVTLQENNGVAVVDLETRDLLEVFSAGTVDLGGIDTEEDGLFDFTGSLDDAPREPDAVQWVGDGLVATANEGDWKGGTRGWTVFDSDTGAVVWDSGTQMEYLAVEHGLFNEGRSDSKGTEPEGLAFDTIGGTPYAFVGSERSNFVAVYDMSNPASPAFRQVLPTTNGPEGLLPVPSRNLLIVSSETDEAAAGVRATVGVYRLGATTPAFPSLVSKPEPGTTVPIGWGAIGALSGAPGNAGRMWAASDAAYATGRIYSVDVTRTPAVIDDVLEVSGGPADIDVEGLFARPGGGFWIANEGLTGAGNKLVRTDAEGVVTQTVELPRAVTSHVKSWGLEGVTAVGSGAAEEVYVALQRPLWVDPSKPAAQLQPLEGNVARIGRYRVATGEWTWFSYPLSTTSAAGDWIGLSEITTVDDNTLAVIERDKLNGPRAALKRIYTVDVPEGSATALTPLAKTQAIDLLPAMQAQKGWTQEKLEGFGISSGGQLFAATDNDGLDDATGETQLYRLGSLKQVFAAATATTTKLKVSKKKVVRGTKVTFTAKVAPRFADGKVRFTVKGKKVRTVALKNGVATATVRLGKVGKLTVRALYLGDEDARASSSSKVKVTVTKARKKGKKRP